MIDSIIAFSIRNKLIVFLMVAGLVAWGAWSVTKLPIDAVPDITNNQVQVITQSPALAAQEVEQYITAPLELSLANLPKVEEIRSISRFGLSVITVVFDDDVDILDARQLVSEQIKKAEKDIPAEFGAPELAPITTGLGEIYQYIIKTKPGYESKYDATDLRTIQDWIVKRQLAGIEGVIEINSFGGKVKEYEISINPTLMNSQHVSLAMVFDAVSNNNQNTGGSYIEKGTKAYFIRGEGILRSIEDIENIAVETRNNSVVKIKDIADVKIGHSPRFGAMSANGKGEVVGAIIMMLKGENSSKVISHVKERIDKIQSTLPEGVVIEPFLDRTHLVNKTIKTVAKNLAEGGLIVVFVLVLMLGNFRAGIIVASVIPLAMLFALGMMDVFGVSANLMSLGAIDFGLVVDGSVIIVESIIHHLHSEKKAGKLSGEEVNNLVYRASVKIRQSAAFGEIIILMVYIPILALTGIEGKMFKPMAQTVSFAIIGALILSLTYVPMMSAFLLNKEEHFKPSLSDRMIDYLSEKYRKALDYSLKHGKIMLTGITLLFILSIVLFSRLGGEFIPQLDEGDFAIETRLMQGTSLSETIETSKKAEQILLTFPEVEKVVSKIGTSEVPTDPMPIEANDLMVVLKDKDEWTSAESKEELAEKMNEALSVLPGVNFDFQQPIQMRFNELMTGVKSDVAIKIFGEDLNLLTENANQTAKLLETIEGVTDIKVEQVSGMPQLVVSYNRSALSKYGLSVNDVNTIINTGFAGGKTGVLFEGDKRFDIVVRLNKNYKESMDVFESLMIDLPNGNKIPLTEVAITELKDAPLQVSREDTKRRITIGFNVRKRDVETVVKDAELLLAQKLKLPIGYHLTYGGQFENLVKAKQRLSIAIPLALFIIFVLLYITFSSIKQAVFIFTAIPLSAIGGIVALWLRDMPFSISAGVGFIALFGVAVLNGIVMIGYYNQLEKEGVHDIYERIITGSITRLRPVLMTAAVASLGFLPMALSSSAGAEVQKPLATVVIGGLISATLLTLFIIPVIYMLFSKTNIKATGVVVMLAIMLMSVSGYAQTNEQVDLRTALEFAAKNNGRIQSYTKEEQIQSSLKKTTFDLPKTTFDFQKGQISALPSDFSFQIVQGFNFPTYYIQKAAVANKNIEAAALQTHVQKLALYAEIKTSFYKIVMQQNLLKIVLKQDSLYNLLVKAAALKYQTGEGTLLEKKWAESKSGDIKNTINIIKSAIAAEEVLLRNKVGSTDNSSFATMIPPKYPSVFSESQTIENNPYIKWLDNETSIRKKEISLQRSTLLPELRIGYFNQSIEKVRNFQVMQAGFSFPLWSRPYAYRLKSANLMYEKQQLANNYMKNTAKAELEALLKRHSSLQQSVAFYENTLLPENKLLLETAWKSYRGGEIGFIEYVQSADMYWQNQKNYLNEITALNETAIQIELITGKNLENEK